MMATGILHGRGAAVAPTTGDRTTAAPAAEDGGAMHWHPIPAPMRGLASDAALELEELLGLLAQELGSGPTSEGNAALRGMTLRALQVVDLMAKINGDPEHADLRALQRHLYGRSVSALAQGCV